MSAVLVVTGFNREVATLRQPGLRLIAGGGDAQALRKNLTREAAAGALGIASYGMTGALADGLAVGDWVVGDRLSGAVELECDPAWRAALQARLPGSQVGGFFADGRMIDSIEEKLALGARHRALAVDMESHVAAAVAIEHGLPFAIVRCVSDGARHMLPHAITVSMRPDGGVDGAAMLRSLASRPGQIPDVVRTISGFMKSMKALKQGAARIGPRLAFP